jgi:hypothetical protein
MVTGTVLTVLMRNGVSRHGSVSMACSFYVHGRRRMEQKPVGLDDDENDEMNLIKKIVFSPLIVLNMWLNFLRTESN